MLSIQHNCKLHFDVGSILMFFQSTTTNDNNNNNRHMSILGVLYGDIIKASKKETLADIVCCSAGYNIQNAEHCPLKQMFDHKMSMILLTCFQCTTCRLLSFVQVQVTH